MKERLEESPSLREILKEHGIRVAIIDADGTLFDTSRHFRSYMENFTDYLAGHSGRERGELFNLMLEVIGRLRPFYRVHPTVMAEAARITSLYSDCGFYSEETQIEYRKLMNLYETAPEIFPGVKETLELLKNSGLSLALFTHSFPEWAEKKLATHSIRDLFSLVFTVPPLEMKDENSLKEAIEKLGVKENQVLVVGDSLPSDIRPAVNIGIPKTNIFRVYTDYDASNAGGEVDGVVEIQSFSQLPEAIVEKLSLS